MGGVSQEGQGGGGSQELVIPGTHPSGLILLSDAGPGNNAGSETFAGP